MLLGLTSFVIAAILALILVPWISRYAIRLHLVDQPDSNRKLHKSAIPLIGGIAVFLSICITLVLVWALGRESIILKPGDFREFLGLFLGSGFILLIGVLDDSIGLRGRQKLVGQIIAVLILVGFGFRFNKFELFDISFEFGIFSILVVTAWFLAVVNSINLLDGADGFAATIGIIMSIALSFMAYYHPSGRPVDALILLAMAGALCGFLRFNFPPAKVFLGDAGSMLIGFVLAAISIRCTFKQNTAYAFFAPMALLAIPFIDTGAAIIRRKLTGRSIYTVDRGHLHHTMIKRGFSPTIALLWVASLCTMTAAGGTIAFIYRRAEFAMVSIVLVVFVMIIGRIFGAAEFELISNKAKAFGKTLVGGKQNGKSKYHQSTVQLQGNRDWQEIWEQLCEFSDEHELNEITFDLHLPWIHESFHANRRRADAKKSEFEEWYSQLPLIVHGKIFGRIELHVSKNCRFSHHDIICNALKLTTDIEKTLFEKTMVSADEWIDSDSNSQFSTPDDSPIKLASADVSGTASVQEH
jgi:UDP-GlcNAc:undecaprenyl-phosphate GlcNAc-1-phosphate transferase